MDLYRRLRHTYGFGVHSPLAFRIVSDVLTPGRRYGFYGTEEIEIWLDRWAASPGEARCEYNSRHALRRDARLLLRLAVFLDADSIWLPGEVPSPVRVAVMAADSRMKIFHKREEMCSASLVVVFGSSANADSLPQLLKQNPEINILLLRSDPERTASLLGNAAGGVMFRGRQRSILIGKRTGPLHLYDIL